MHKISIETDPKFVGLSDDRVKKLINHVFTQEKILKSDTTIIFGDEDLLRSLKKEFFNIDHTTDVIAFRLNDYGEINIDGEIYICLPVAKENAIIYAETYEREVARLVIHGGLQLIGYDDGTEEDRINMRKLENKYLEDLEF